MLVNSSLVIKLRWSVFVANKVVTSRSETVVVTVEVWKQLLQNMMLIALDSVEQTFVSIFSELGSSGVTKPRN